MSAPKDDDPHAQGAGEDGADDAADLAQAYRDLARLTNANRGEQAASTLEANLTSLESKLDAMLAAFEAAEGGGDADAKNEGKQSHQEEDKAKKGSGEAS